VLKYIRKVITDDSGKFEFKNLAKGKFYLYSPIVYEIPNPNGGHTKTNAYVYKTVRIKEGEELEIILKK